jgi:hypothetical protein
VDVTATLDTPASPEDLFKVVEDLTRYPEWLDIVAKVRPEPDGAWAVDLRGRLGPLAKLKRLRMVRAEHEPPASVRFEREELDGRSHSPWVLAASVSPADDGSRLRMDLHYGGGLFGPVLERLLGDEIERSKPRLLALLAT